MAPSSRPPKTDLLMQTLDEKIKLLISQSLVANLEISQLQQQNARLIKQLGEKDTPAAKLIHP